MTTVLVTGSTDGIGRATALGLAAQGARVIVHGRNADRLASIAAELRAISPDAHGGSIRGDLGSIAGALAVAEALPEPIDVLINNAAIIAKKRELSPDRVEMTLAVNHVAAHVLTVTLLGGAHRERLRRVVTVSSGMHAQGRLPDPNDLAWADRPWNSLDAYATSKLCNVLFTNALAERFPGVACNALHPGVVSTNLLKSGWGGSFSGPDTADHGAATSIMLALDPRYAHVTGRYFAKQAEARASALSGDRRLSERLWAATEKIRAAG